MVDVRELAAASLAVLLTSSAAYASADLARAKNCVACHSVERKMIGPAYKAMAERYGVPVNVANDSQAAALAEYTFAGGERVRASYVVGADGGRSATRKALGLEFAGISATADWFVIDIRNDPLGHPGAYVCADPRRPYVSISIPHGIRRFEFMLKPGEEKIIAARLVELFKSHTA